MSRARTEVADDHAGSEIEGRDHRVRVAQAILTRSAGVEPSADRSGQPVEGHALRPSPKVGAGPSGP